MQKCPLCNANYYADLFKRCPQCDLLLEDDSVTQKIPHDENAPPSTRRRFGRGDLAAVVAIVLVIFVAALIWLEK